MATFSNNAESKSVSRDVPVANPEQSSPALPLDPAKSAGVNDDDEHIIRKSDSLIGSRL